MKLVEKLCTKDATVRPSCASLLNEDGFVTAYDWDRGGNGGWRETFLGLEMSGAARELRRRSTGRLRGSTNDAQRLKRA